MTNLIHTSVQDAHSSLICDLERDPSGTARLALDTLVEIRGRDGHASRRKMLVSVIRQSARAIANSEEPNKHGASAGDYYAEIPTGDLREWVQMTVDDDPAKAAGEMINTLNGLRGEYGTASRRKILAAGVGKAAKSLEANHD